MSGNHCQSDLKKRLCLLPLMILLWSHAGAAGIPAELFLNFLHQQTADTMCSNQPLLNCMETDRQTCLTEVSPLSDSCRELLEQQLPENIAETDETLQLYSSRYMFCMLDAWKLAQPSRSESISACFNR